MIAMMIAKFVLVAIIGYLIGSIPFGALISKRVAKVDVREHGSGKTGATNVLRVAGKKAAVLVIVLDALKGVVAVLFAGLIVGGNYLVWRNFGLGLMAAQVIAALAAMAGHNWSIFLKFKGGKGIATAIGVLLLTSPLSVLILYLIIIPIIILITNDSFMSASIGFLIFPLILWFLEKNIWWVIFGILIAVVIIIRHLEELKTYFSGRRELNPIVEKMRNYILRKNSQKQNTHL